MSDEPIARRGSLRWVTRVAEAISWATVVVLFLVLNVADLDPAAYRDGLIVVGAAGVWLLLFYRGLLPRRIRSWWAVGVPLVSSVAFAAAFFWLLFEQVPSLQVVFIPGIVATGLLAGLWGGLVSSLLSVAAFAAITRPPLSGDEAIDAGLTAGLFILSGLVSGILARELRTHYRGEQEEHRLATAVRHRLLAVLDAVDEPSSSAIATRLCG